MRLCPKKKVRWVLLRQGRRCVCRPLDDGKTLEVNFPLAKPHLAFRWRWVARLTQWIIDNTVFFDENTALLSFAEWAALRVKGEVPTASDIHAYRVHDWIYGSSTTNKVDFGSLREKGRYL